jgi:hypothetical protein
MGSEEGFCLRWNDFESSVAGTFRNLRSHADFFDVTLVTPDTCDQIVQAHKVILSACSDVFRDMLRHQSNVSVHPHPVIYLRGVTYSVLQSILDFVYHGEVSIAQQDLDSFLAVAEDFQGSILQNCVSAENFSDNVSIHPQISDKVPPKTTDIKLSDYCGLPTLLYF